MSEKESKEQKYQGKIIKAEAGYEVTKVAIYVLREFNIDPCKITLSEKWDWCRHDCCICGISFNTYTPNAQIEISEHIEQRKRQSFPICDICLKANCSDLHVELVKQQAEFDKALNAGYASPR